MAELEATDVDPDAFPLLLDMDGNITEGIGANFFIDEHEWLRFAELQDMIVTFETTAIIFIDGTQLGEAQ